MVDIFERQFRREFVNHSPALTRIREKRKEIVFQGKGNMLSMQHNRLKHWFYLYTWILLLWLKCTWKPNQDFRFIKKTFYCKEGQVLEERQCDISKIGSVILETMNFIGIVKFDAQLSSHVTHFCLFIWPILIPCLSDFRFSLLGLYTMVLFFTTQQIVRWMTLCFSWYIITSMNIWVASLFLIRCLPSGSCWLPIH